MGAARPKSGSRCQPKRPSCWIISLLWFAVVLGILGGCECSCLISHQTDVSRGAASNPHCRVAPSHNPSITPETEELSPYYRRDRRYSGDSYDATSIPNATGLTNLLAARYLARRESRAQGDSNSESNVFDIDRELRERFHVRVYDQPPIWSPWDSEPPLAFHRRRVERTQKLLEEKFGPLGHPYQHVGRTDVSALDCPLVHFEPEIHNRLRLMAECVLSGQYEKAQTLQFELSLLGVMIHSETNEWTMDPNHVFQSSAKNERNNTMFSRQHVEPHTQEQPSILEKEGDLAPDRTRIEQLLSLRTKALLTGDNVEAAHIALELWQTYGVGVCDASKRWFAAKNSSNAIPAEWGPPTAESVSRLCAETARDQESAAQFMFPPLLDWEELEPRWQSPSYNQSVISLSLDPMLKRRVQKLVQERVHKRESGFFREADAIRRELWHTYVSESVEATLFQNFCSLELNPSHSMSESTTDFSSSAWEGGL